MRPEIDARIVQKLSWTLQIFKLRAVRLRGCAGHVDRGLCIVERDDGRRIPANEIGVALDIPLCLLKRGLRAVDNGLDALHVGLDLPAIQREQQVALLHRGAVAEMNICDGRVDLRLDRNTGDGRDVAESGETHRHGLALGHSRFNRDRAGLTLPRRHPVRGPEAARKHGNSHQGERRPTNEPFSLDHR